MLGKDEEGYIYFECPKCKREHDKMREPDGSITDFCSAPDWFIQEWNEHMQKLQQRDVKFRQLAFQETEIQQQKIEMHKLLKETEKRTHNIVESGCRRLKLLKRKDIDWAYNPGVRKFIGRPKPAQVGVKK